MANSMCLTCSHPSVFMIDQLLGRGQSALSVSKKFGLNYNTVKRHVAKGHVIKRERPGEPGAPKEASTALEGIHELIALLEKAQEEKMGPQATATISRELRLAYESLAKMQGPVAPPVFDPTTSKEWIDLREVITEALRPFPPALEALLKAIEKYLERPSAP
jgi:hypothetical protein